MGPVEEQLEPNVLCLSSDAYFSVNNKIAFLGIVILTGRYTILHCPGFKAFAELSGVICLLVCSLSLSALQIVLHCSVLTLMHVLLLNPRVWQYLLYPVLFTARAQPLYTRTT